MALFGLLGLPIGASDARAERSPEADIRYELGARALRQQDLPRALASLEQAVELADRDGPALSLYARALLHAGRYEEADAILERLEAVDPAASDLGMLKGIAALGRERPEVAVTLLREARDANPGHAWTRVWLAAAYQRQGAWNDATRELQQAARLDPSLRDYVSYRLGVGAEAQGNASEAEQLFRDVERLAPGSTLANSARAHLRTMSGGTERPWNAYVSLGGEYDTNPSLAGSTESAQVSGDNDYQGIVTAGFDYQLVEQDELQVRVGWAGYLGAHRDENDLDIEANRLNMIATYDVRDDTRLELDYRFDWAWADWSAYRRSHTFIPSVRLQPASNLITRIYYRHELRDFFTEASRRQLDRDGRIQRPGIDQYVLLPQMSPWGGGYVRVGGFYRNEDSQGNNFDAHGAGGELTLGFSLPEQTVFLVEGGYERREFDNVSLFGPFDGDRSDSISRVRVALRRPLDEHLWLEAGWRYTHWNSNVKFYDFDRSVSHFRLTYEF